MRWRTLTDLSVNTAPHVVFQADKKADCLHVVPITIIIDWHIIVVAIADAEELQRDRCIGLVLPNHLSNDYCSEVLQIRSVPVVQFVAHSCWYWPVEDAQVLKFRKLAQHILCCVNVASLNMVKRR